MKKLLSIILIPLLSGCSTIPALGNVKQYNRCSPVYETHVPGQVAQTAALVDFLKKNPSMADKFIPVTGAMDVVGRNAAQIGTGVASAVTAINGNISVASVVGSAIMASVKSLADARSEDKTQSRVSFCVEDNTGIAVFKDKNVDITIVKTPSKEAADVIRAIKSKEIRNATDNT